MPAKACQQLDERTPRASLDNPYDRMRPKVLEALRVDLEAHVARELARLTDGLDRRLGPSVQVMARTNWWQ